MSELISQENENRFSLGSQVGGPDAAMATMKPEQQLRDAMNHWRGNYASRIKEFAFVLRVDGEIHCYTEKWNIHGAQKAKRKKDFIEVEIGVPRSAWQAGRPESYKHYLAAEVEKGLHSMIEVLQKSHLEINAEALLSDWEKIKKQYLSRESSARVQ